FGIRGAAPNWAGFASRIRIRTSCDSAGFSFSYYGFGGLVLAKRGRQEGLPFSQSQKTREYPDSGGPIKILRKIAKARLLKNENSESTGGGGSDAESVG
ncbi:MAG: hypothetical protein ACO3E8_06930, partial [Candidatus Methylacidiphilales bacterium]